MTMWHLLLAVVVAGSTGFATKHFLTPRNTVENANLLHDPNASDSQTQYYGSRSRPTRHRHRGPKKGVRVQKVKQRPNAEVRKGGRRRLLFCLSKRNITAKPPFCSSKDNSLFGWGLSFGIVFMMSAGRAEIHKLNKTMNETAKLVQELKSELNRRKSSCAHQILDSVGHIDMNSRKTNSELIDNDDKIWSPAVNDCDECGSSALTEEPEPRVLDMDQLEAELEVELQKLSGGAIDSPCHEELKPKLDKLEALDVGCHGTDDGNFTYSQSYGVLASELNQKLSHLLIEQQENQILELQSELHQAQSNLHEKAAELQALKNCVRRLTEPSLSTVSDDETQAFTDPKGTKRLGQQ